MHQRTDESFKSESPDPSLWRALFRYVGPDLGPNGLQRSSPDALSGQFEGKI